MQDDVTDIRSLYDSNPARERERLERHQLEHDMTCKLLRRYLHDRRSVLEVGAGVGTYTVTLAREGHDVTAVDLAPAMVDACRQAVDNAGVGDRVTCQIMDARDLRALDDRQFDAVLLMGPLYHLVYDGDRRLALGQAYDHLVPGGLLLSSFISRYGILGDLLRKMPGWIERDDEVRSVMERGRDPENMPKGGFRGYFSDVTEIAPLHESVGFQTVELAAVEPAISADDDAYNALEGKRRELWLDLFFGIRTNPTIIGASRHVVYVGRRAEE
ncbi:MAG: methyltransferase domain-containing protein [Chitinivibrionales bacterium]|nr:methyltransferase domain-containing protein [Chitinivibrionales bacterium]